AAIVPAISFASDGTMHEMRDIGDRLQGDLGPVERATSGGGARRELLGATLLAFFLGFALILAATRLVKDVLDLIRQTGHCSLLKGHRFPQRRVLAPAQRSTGTTWLISGRLAGDLRGRRPGDFHLAVSE